MPEGYVEVCKYYFTHLDVLLVDLDGLPTVVCGLVPLLQIQIAKCPVGEVGRFVGILYDSPRVSSDGIFVTTLLEVRVPERFQVGRRI